MFFQFNMVIYEIKDTDCGILGKTYLDKKGEAYFFVKTSIYSSSNLLA
jgi:hypothetical protein